MAFTKRTTTSSNPLIGSTGDISKLDTSQVAKLNDIGLTTTNVTTDAASLLQSTVPAVKTTTTGIQIPGYQDSKGEFYVIDQKNNVVNVSEKPVDETKTDNIITTTTPVQTTSVPPANLGSGKIYSRFDVGDVVPNESEIVTRNLWSGDISNLLYYFTSSVQTSDSKQYYYSIYTTSSICNSDVQFAIAYGHKMGSGSADQGGQINDTPTRAIYSQYKQLCLEPSEERFRIGGLTTDSIYVINVTRARMREFIDEGNLEINLQKLSGSQWLSGGHSQNAWTGSNVQVLPTKNVIRLIDDSRISNTVTVTSAGEVYNIISGSLEDGAYNPSTPHYYGLLYRRLGVIVLNGDTLDLSGSFLTVTGSEVPGDNAMKLFKSMSGSALYTDASGDYLGFQGRSGENIKATHYFVRVKNQEYNFTNNPTFVTGSEGDLSQPTMIGNPNVYITTIGLYDDDKRLLATAKVNKPINKNYTKEALIRVKLMW